MTIGALVDRERRHLRAVELATGLLLGVGAAALLVGVSAVLLGHARWLVLPRALPLLVWLVVALAIGGIFARTRHRLTRRGSRRDVALAIEAEQGMRRGLLLGALELEGQGALAARAANVARAGLPDGAPLAPALRRTGSRAAIMSAGLGAAGVLVLATASPLFGDGLRAVLRPIAAWRGDLLAPLRIVDAPRELLRGAPLSVRIVAPGRARVFISHRQTGDAWHTDTLVAGRDGTMPRWTLPALHGDLILAASDGRASSDSALVHAVDRPFVGAVTLHVDYPAYLSRASETLPVGERLRLPHGTVLSIAGRASVPLARVWLHAAELGDVQLNATGHTFSGRLVATRSAELRWSASGAGGVVPDVPAPLQLEVLADSAPRIAIAAPTVDTLLATDDEAALTLTASDDHGIASIVLRTTRIAGTVESSSTQPVASAAGTSWSGTATLDIAALRLEQGESARVRAEAVDASPWNQRGVSRELVIKRPTMSERRDVARALGDSAAREARAAVAAQRSLAQRTDEAARAQARTETSANASAPGSPPAARNAPMSFASAEKARGLAQEQRAMAERVQKLREATQQLERQLKAAGALDTALARQLGEAQALLRQALTPQMMAQMQKLESAAQQLNGEQSRDALRDLAQMQQRMKEQLEKSAEMLKRAAHEGAMQTLADQAKELAQRERSLAEGQKSSVDPAAAAREAAKLAEQTKRMRDQMQELGSRLAADKADAGATRTEQAGEHAASAETKMRRASNEMRAQAAGEAHASPEGEQPARDAANEMDAAAKSMRDAREAQVKDWKKELTSELDQSVQEMMQLARQERALEQQAHDGAKGSEQRGAQSAVEQGVDKARERLSAAAKRSALLSSRSQRAMSDAKDKVGQATQSVTQSSSGGAGQPSASALGEAADALTKAAASLARDRERANSAGSASGFSEMLQEMQQAASRQGQINGQAQSLMAMPGGAAGSSGQSLARSLARQQRGVADQLEDAGDAVGGDRAAELAREARQLADQLDGGRLDAGTLARQQQLFRRLLDAGRSLEKEEREDSGKRESKSATGANTFVPGTTPDARAASRFRPPTWQELRGLSADERRAILDYFTRLNSAPPR